MTSRADITYLDLDSPADETLRVVIGNAHSHFPVASGGLDHAEGMVRAQTVLRKAAPGQPVDLASCFTKALFVPQTLTVMEVVESFKKHRQTVTLVINEFGIVQGLLTFHDVMEALVGDIATIAQPEEDIDIVRREDGSWLVDGGVAIERFKDVIGVDAHLPEEDSGAYHTVGGFAMARLGRVPSIADHFTWESFRFEVMDMDENRVDKLIVTPMNPKF